MSANHHLGVAHDLLGHILQAIEFHEQHKRLAQESGVQSELQVSNMELIKVYKKHGVRSPRFSLAFYCIFTVHSSLLCLPLLAGGT